MNSISLELKLNRLKSHLSQVELGKICGLPQSAISAIENQKRDITVRTLNRICEALKISWVNLEPHHSPLENLNRHELDKIALQIITGKRELSDEENKLCDEIELLVLTKLRAVNVPRPLFYPHRRTFVAKRWSELKTLYSQKLITHLLDRIDKHLWKYIS